MAGLLTVLLNIPVHCNNKKRKKKIQEYINRMQHSGYSKKQRAMGYRKAKKKYDRKIRLQEDSGEPMYRGRNWNLEERMRQKTAKKRNWYKNGGSEAVFFVNATPNRSLAKACSDEFKKAGLQVRLLKEQEQRLRC